MGESELMEAGFKKMDARKVFKAEQAEQETGNAHSAHVSKKTRSDLVVV
jgi:hypothetical protein